MESPRGRELGGSEVWGRLKLEGIVLDVVGCSDSTRPSGAVLSLMLVVD